MKPAPMFVSPPQVQLPPGTTVRLSSRETQGEYCVCEMTTPPGHGVPAHVHDRDEEFYYVLEGAYEFQAGDKRYVAETGSMVVIPRDVPHSFYNRSNAVARALMIFRPGGFDELIGEIRQSAAAGTLDERQRRAIHAKWGVKFLDSE
jgi:quercetin dioxygenase-like cupin family protein